MTLRHLKIFVTVADTRNMTEAAGKLFIAQPSVSQSVGELEKHLKVRLFERLGRKLYLTESGQKFLSYARHVIALVEEAESTMLSMNEKGRLRVAGSLSVGTTLLTGLIRQFKEEYPPNHVTFVVENTGFIEKMIFTNEVDVAIVEGEMKSDHIITMPLMEDDLVLICGTNHRFAGKTNIGADDLEGEYFIIREEKSGTRELFEAVMASRNISYDVTGIMNNAEAIKQAVIEGLGISVISGLAVAEEVKRGELATLKIRGVHFRRNFSIAYHRNKFVFPAMKNFIDMSCRYYGKIQEK